MDIHEESRRSCRICRLRERKAIQQRCSLCDRGKCAKKGLSPGGQKNKTKTLTEKKHKIVLQDGCVHVYNEGEGLVYCDVVNRDGGFISSDGQPSFE